jgi:hypothetical protein
MTLALVLPTGCGETTPAAGDDAPSATGTWTPTAAESSLAPSALPVTERSARRVTVDQLRRSLPALFGGESWTYETQASNRGPAETYELLTVLSRTLGEADFIEVTTPNIEPSPLFQKFMSDLAAQLCAKGLARDANGGAVEDKLIVPYPQDTDANLRFLRLKFHGIYIAEDADTETDGLAGLRSLYNDIEADTGAEDAWLGVCIAMVTAPEFLAY